MISPCANPNIDLGPYAGVEILCIFFAMALWGVTCMQTFLYFFNNRGNRATTALVTWIWVMDTVHQCLLMAGSYKGNVSGEMYLTNNVRIEFVIQMLFTSLVSVPTQAFFIYRIWRLAGNCWIVPLLGIPVILFELAVGIMIVVLNVHAKTGSQLTERTEMAVFISNFVVGALTDIAVSAALSIMLYSVYLKDSSKFPRTITLLHRLILFSIFTGTWTALVAIAAMAMLVAYPTNYIYVGFYFVLSPMYCNSLLANVNARPYLRDTLRNDVHTMSFVPSTTPTGVERSITLPSTLGPSYDYVSMYRCSAAESSAAQIFGPRDQAC